MDGVCGLVGVGAWWGRESLNYRRSWHGHGGGGWAVLIDGVEVLDTPRRARRALRPLTWASVGSRERPSRTYICSQAAHYAFYYRHLPN